MHDLISYDVRSAKYPFCNKNVRRLYTAFAAFAGAERKNKTAVHLI